MKHIYLTKGVQICCSNGLLANLFLTATSAIVKS